jgi:hypothetical protein
MSTHRKPGRARTASAPGAEKLLEQYGCGPIQNAKRIYYLSMEFPIGRSRTIAEYAAEIWDAKPCPVP